MADYLKNFAEKETILASDTNSNNQYLLNKINENYDKLKTWLDGEVGRINSNIKSGDATLQASISALQNSVNSTIRVTERYDNGTQWYEYWSDGTLVQGGCVPSTSVRTASAVTFLKPFANTNYYIQITSMDQGSSDLGKYNYTQESGATSNRTKTGFTIIWNWGGRYWEARGKRG